jgi:hypothetical protein
MSLHVSQVSPSDNEFLTDLEGACGCQGEKSTQFFVGLWEGMGPEAQGGPLDLCLHHLTIQHFCVLSLVAQLSDGYCQEKTK